MVVPTTPSEWESLLARMSEEDRAEVMAILEADLAECIWRPQVGRQSEAQDVRADVIGYGGSAGGGKSDLIAGLALTEHARSAVFRREKVQCEGIIQRVNEILGANDGYNSQKSFWKYDGRLIEFAGLDGPKDHQKWQGRAHDFKAYDEVTEMRMFQVLFTMGWNRSASAEQIKRVLMTFNPPTTTEGRWVLEYFGPWLLPNHPRPAQPGELRYYSNVNGKDTELETNDRFVMFKGESLYDFDPADFGAEKIITPKSRTFIPSRATDNYFYVKSGYIEQLQALPEPLRSQMLEGDFMAGVEDDAWQAIPTSWIDAAMARWEEKDDPGDMDSIGVDPAAGGQDNLVAYPRHGLWFGMPKKVPGREIPQERAGPIAAAHVIEMRRDRAVVHGDVIGWGLSCMNFLTEQDVQNVAVNAAGGTDENQRDAPFMKFFNVRAKMVWRMREALDPESPDGQIALPPVPELKADLAAYRWTITKGGIKIGSKDEMKEDLGRSPDDGDACCLANMETLKREVSKLIKPRRAYNPYSDIED